MEADPDTSAEHTMNTETAITAENTKTYFVALPEWRYDTHGMLSLGISPPRTIRVKGRLAPHESYILSESGPQRAAPEGMTLVHAEYDSNSQREVWHWGGNSARRGLDGQFLRRGHRPNLGTNMIEFDFTTTKSGTDYFWWPTAELDSLLEFNQKLSDSAWRAFRSNVMGWYCSLPGNFYAVLGGSPCIRDGELDLLWVDVAKTTGNAPSSVAELVEVLTDEQAKNVLDAENLPEYQSITRPLAEYSFTVEYRRARATGATPDYAATLADMKARWPSLDFSKIDIAWICEHGRAA